MLRISDMKIEVISNILQFSEETLQKDLQTESKRTDLQKQKTQAEAMEKQV